MVAGVYGHVLAVGSQGCAGVLVVAGWAKATTAVMMSLNSQGEAVVEVLFAPPCVPALMADGAVAVEGLGERCQPRAAVTRGIKTRIVLSEIDFLRISAPRMPFGGGPLFVLCSTLPWKRMLRVEGDRVTDGDVRWRDGWSGTGVAAVRLIAPS
jgi:hypothetical protein